MTDVISERWSIVHHSSSTAHSKSIPNQHNLHHPLFVFLRASPSESTTPYDLSTSCALRVERHVPQPDAPVCACARELPVLEPEYRIDTSGDSVLDRDVLHRFLNAPDIDVRIERARRAVSPVRGP